MQMKRLLQNKKILVTGGAGFIGSNLIEHMLNNNNYVVCLDNFSTGKHENIIEFKTNKNFELIEGDIIDYKTCAKAVSGTELVFHQAALGSVPRSINNPIATNEVNISGFLNIIDASVKANVKRFIYAASSSTYGDNEDLPKVEDIIGNPKSPYAVTKYVNELYAQVFAKLYGIETIGLRYFNVFGEKQSPDGEYAAVFPKFIKLLLQHKQPLIHGDGTQSRDFTYIENVVFANELAATTVNPSAINQVFNIAYGESNSLNELTQLLIKYLSEFDKEVENIEPIYGPERTGDIKHSLASISKAANLLGYKPTIDVRTGLKKAINWYYQTLK